ncbi:hypothetical protein DFH08DRAFT_965746 [Mycena albidolilacea]|uniref:Uncharacterized protein n=1 Tax=Mycena albidolilacea TaxID=1033008 RepID=A0AAD6ZPS6_9AGAR|nr:hypothetical protein DFH08DRAFT_965746 [Mycena albidolilacea]
MFPLTLRRHNRRVALPMMKSADQHLPPEAQGRFFLHSSLPLPLFPLPSLPPAFLPQVRVCVNDAFVAQAAGPEDRARIVDAICADGGEILMHRSQYAVQRCLDTAMGPEEYRQILACMRYVIRPSFPLPCTNTDGLAAQRPHRRPHDTATDHVPQNLKALDCEEEVCLLIVSELFCAAPATTLVNKQASHMWNKRHKSLKGKWAALAYHETGSLVAQHALEKPGESARTGSLTSCSHTAPRYLVRTRRASRAPIASSTVLLEHGSEKHRQMALEHPLTALLEFATNERVRKSVVKALKEGGKETLDRVAQPAKGAGRAIILIASVLLKAKDRCAALYDCIRAHIVALCACKTGYKVIWLFDRMRTYSG